MEQNSTKRSNKDVPNTTLGLRTDVSDDIFDFSDVEVPRIGHVEPIKPIEFDTSWMNSIAKDMERMGAQLQRDAERLSAEATKTAEEWNKKFMEDFKKRRDNMTYREYVDSDGYKVVEGKSKDGRYTIIQRMKNVGGKFESEMEIIESGKLFYKSSSITNSYSYRNGNGDFVTVEDRAGKKTSERVYTTPHSRVIKRKKKTTNVWGKILLCVVIAVILYIVFFR